MSYDMWTWFFPLIGVLFNLFNSNSKTSAQKVKSTDKNLPTEWEKTYANCVSAKILSHIQNMLEISKMQ